jgi:hypothetical protein
MDAPRHRGGRGKPFFEWPARLSLRDRHERCAAALAEPAGVSFLAAEPSGIEAVGGE